MRFPLAFMEMLKENKICDISGIQQQCLPIAYSELLDEHNDS